MSDDAFEDELAELLEKARATEVPRYQLERIVAKLYRSHGRQVPDPILPPDEQHK